jgi:hypothetical protein
MEKPHRVAITIIFAAVLTLLAPVIALQLDYLRYHWRFAPPDTLGDKAMVVSAHGLASEVGRDVLAAGGNAFDAAVAVNFAPAISVAAGLWSTGWPMAKTGRLIFVKRHPWRRGAICISTLTAMSLRARACAGI